MASLTSHGALPYLIERPVLDAATNEAATLPPVGENRRQGHRAGLFPTAPAQPDGHPINQRRRLGAQLVAQPKPPLLEESQRTEAIPIKGPGLHLGPDRVFTQVIERLQPVGQDLDAAEISGAAAPVHQADEGFAQRREEPRTLLIAPHLKFRGVGDVEIFEKPSDIQGRGELIAEDVAAAEPVQVEFELAEGESHQVAGGFQRLGAQLAAEYGERCSHRMTSLER
jgi:hypothetical protein